MDCYLGHLGGVLIFLEHYRGILGFWYYNNSCILFVRDVGQKYGIGI